MGIIRKDYVLNRYVFYASARKGRPHDFSKEEVKIATGVCYFCPGSENLTPPEIGRIGTKEKWEMRWFENKFPAVEKKGSPKLSGKKFFKESSNFGVHQIISETNCHSEELSEKSVGSIASLLSIYHERITDLSKDKRTKYVSVFKNHGKDAGTSLVHEHSQIVSVPKLPPFVEEELASLKGVKSCPYCEIIKKESKSKRLIFENEGFVAIAPFASRFNYEAWIVPKKHLKSLADFSEKDYLDCASLLKKILLKLKETNASYNYHLHYSPSGENLHFRIEITPRMATYAGFELGTGFIINSVLPEDAAEYYREVAPKKDAASAKK